MRVTDADMFERGRLAMERARSNAARAQDEASSGLRVQKPSDDPVAAASARLARADEARARMQVRAQDEARAGLDASDAALASIGDILSQARERAVQLATDTTTPTDRLDAATEIDALRDAAIAQANTEVAGRYVFGGFLDGAAPFDPVTGAYAGDSSTPQVDGGNGLRIDVGIPGDQALGVGGPGDVVQALTALAAALRAGPSAPVQASLGALTSATNVVAEARSQLGVKMQSLDVARSVREGVGDDAARLRSANEDADPFSAYSKLAQARSALEAAVKLASELPFPGLVERR